MAQHTEGRRENRGGRGTASWRPPSGDGVTSWVGRAMLTGVVHRAVGAEAAVQTLEQSFTPILPILVLPAATHGILVHCARSNLHLEHFWCGE